MQQKPRPTRAIIMELMQDGEERTPLEFIQEIPGKSPNTIYSVLLALGQEGKLRVKRWNRNLETGGRYSPVYVLADGRPSVPCPRNTEPHAVRDRRSRERHKLKKKLKDYARRNTPGDVFTHMVAIMQRQTGGRAR